MNRRDAVKEVIDDLARAWRIDECLSDIEDITMFERVADYLQRGLISEPVAMRAFSVLEQSASPWLLRRIDEALAG